MKASGLNSKSKRKAGKAYRKVKMKKLKKATRKAFKGNKDHKR